MTKCFGYVRVSTVKQGERGVSLQEQRDAIVRYARKADIEISEWFEERETAAKRGRPVFTQMLKALRRGSVSGVVIHKIDRSARNLKDWADLGELIDGGVEVFFASESLDLNSRGGRLSADIQAVVAADFVRNLREETRKGFYGRLKQGLYPLPAPLGYLDQGKGRPKTIDPERAPLVREAFQLYASGQYCLDSLGDELWRRGLRNRRGGRVSRNGLSVLLNNPFYFGLIRIRATGETFDGRYDPLIAKRLFDEVAARLCGKTVARIQRHDFTYRRLLSCSGCGNSLIGERQKGNVYYRCHSSTCRGTSVREEAVDDSVVGRLARVSLSEEELRVFRCEAETLIASGADGEAARRERLSLRVGKLKERLGRLTDAFVDGDIEKEIYEERKNAVLREKAEVEGLLLQPPEADEDLMSSLLRLLELAASAPLSYGLANTEEKREILRIATSNRVVIGKEVAVELSTPFAALADRPTITDGDPCRDRPRTTKEARSEAVSTCRGLVERLIEWISESEKGKGLL